jgi:PII-like signaling protein
VDDEAKITAFLAVLHNIFEQAQCGGLIMHEQVHIVAYTSGAR